MKKFISLLVAAVMVLSLCTVSVFAAEEAPAKPEDPCVLFGDVDFDNEVDAADARDTLRCSVGLETFDEAKAARGDLNLDGKIQAIDARSILRLSVELDEIPAHAAVVDEAVEATFTAAGKTEGSHCKVCGTVFVAQTAVASTLETAVDVANAWAAEVGADKLVSATAEEGKAAIALNVDGIWEDMDIDASVFDGFLTKLGEAVNTYLDAEDTVSIDGNNVYVCGKLQNTAVKNALFDMGAGFFYKIANLAEDGVYGTYEVKVNDETIALTISFTGSEANLNKVKGFCQTISEHISAEVVDGDLVIDVIAPDALKNVIVEKAGDDAQSQLDAMPIGNGLGIVGSLNAEEVFGTQASAVNKLCAFACELSPFINKVLSKTEAYAELNNGTTVVLNEGLFECSEFSFSGFVSAFQGVLSDELLDTTVGEFATEDGIYCVPVHLTVDMSSLGLMAGETITETVYVNIHLW